MAAAGAVAAVAAFLPWWTASNGLATLTRNGFQLGANLSFSADGAIALGLGVVLVAIGASAATGRFLPRWLQRSPILVGGGLVWLGISDERSISDTVAGLRRQYPSGIYSVGYGVWLVIVAGGIAVLLGLVALAERRRGVAVDKESWEPDSGDTQWAPPTEDRISAFWDRAEEEGRREGR